MINAFHEFMEASCLKLALEVPEFPTHMGMFEVSGTAIPQDYFTAINPASVAGRQQVMAEISRGLGGFGREQLTPSERLSADILDFFLRYGYERGLTGTAGRDFLQHEYLIRPSVGLQSELPLFLTDLHPMRHPQDAGDYLQRLKAIAVQLKEAGALIVARQKSGFLPPAFLLADSIREIADFIAAHPEKNILYQALETKSENLPGLAENDRKHLLQAARRELLDNTYPAYRELSATLQKQIGATGTEPGLWRLPGGEAYYEFLLRSATTTRLSADDIHQLGLAETGKLENEIIQACRDQGYPVRNISDCHRVLDQDREPPRQDTPAARQAVVARIERLIAEAEQQLPSLFHHWPKGKLTVKAIPRFAESSRNQSYQPPSLDGSRAGFFELNVGQLLSEPAIELPVLVYHEIFPGHHLQITLAQETENLPSLRRIITFDAYIEGWAKYAETIPVEHGLNTDPKLRITRMRRELISTVNLAMDTGIHVKRWTTGKAVQFVCEHTGVDEVFGRYLVHRSASVPAQMCSYKIGMLKMLELREKMSRTLGGAFDIRDFHDTILRNGAVPLDLLDNIVEQEIRGAPTP